MYLPQAAYASRVDGRASRWRTPVSMVQPCPDGSGRRSEAPKGPDRILPFECVHDGILNWMLAIRQQHCESIGVMHYWPSHDHVARFDNLQHKTRYSINATLSISFAPLASQIEYRLFRKPRKSQKFQYASLLIFNINHHSTIKIK